MAFLARIAVQRVMPQGARTMTTAGHINGMLKAGRVVCLDLSELPVSVQCTKDLMATGMQQGRQAIEVCRDDPKSMAVVQSPAIQEMETNLESATVIRHITEQVIERKSGDTTPVSKGEVIIETEQQGMLFDQQGDTVVEMLSWLSLVSEGISRSDSVVLGLSFMTYMIEPHGYSTIPRGSQLMYPHRHRVGSVFGALNVPKGDGPEASDLEASLVLPDDELVVPKGLLLGTRHSHGVFVMSDEKTTDQTPYLCRGSVVLFVDPM